MTDFYGMPRRVIRGRDRWDIMLHHHRASGGPAKYIECDDPDAYPAGPLERIAWEAVQESPYQSIIDAQAKGFGVWSDSSTSEVLGCFEAEEVVERMLERAEAAVSELEEWFPGIDRRAFIIVPASIICRRMRGGGQDYLLFTGPTGSAKTLYVMLGAAICGDSASNIDLSQSPKDIDQSLGYSLEIGSSCILFDEAQKALDDKDFQKAALKFLLRLNETVEAVLKYRAKEEFRLNAAVFLTGTHIPPFLRRNPELMRRIRHRAIKPLSPDNPDWWTTTDGGVVPWRGLDPRHALVADRALSRIFDFCRCLGFRLDLIDGYLGVDRLSSANVAETQEFVHWCRVLYVVWMHSVRAWWKADSKEKIAAIQSEISHAETIGDIDRIEKLRAQESKLETLANLTVDPFYGDAEWVGPGSNFGSKRNWLNFIHPELQKRHPIAVHLIGAEMDEIDGFTGRALGKILMSWEFRLSTLAGATPWERYLGVRNVAAADQSIKIGNCVGWKFGVFKKDTIDWSHGQVDVDQIPGLSQAAADQFRTLEEERRSEWNRERVNSAMSPDPYSELDR